MGVATLPAAAGGGIKLVQRGSAASAGTVTITAVNITKAFVNVFGTASSGAVAASATVSSGTLSSGDTRKAGGQGINFGNGANMNLAATNLSAGTNNLVSAVVQGYLSSSTELIVSGACRWEVVEFA